MNSYFEIFVEGTPVAQPRQRHAAVVNPKGAVFVQSFGKWVRDKKSVAVYCDQKSGRPIVSNYIDKSHKVHQWRKIIETDVKMALKRLAIKPVDFAVGVDLVFVFPRPQSKTSESRANEWCWREETPDKDNLEKAVFDCLNGVLWSDDCKIVTGDTTKLIAGDGDRCGVAIRGRTLDSPHGWADKLIHPGVSQDKLFKGD